MSTIRRTDVRFNLTKEADRRAWDFLRSTGTSRNRIIIAALNTYADQQDEETRQASFRQQIMDTIQSTIQSSLQNVSIPPPSEEAEAAQHEQENVEAMESFLSFFQ